MRLIGATHHEAGLRVRSEAHRGRHPAGVIVTDQQLARISLEPHALQGDWNYTTRPTRR